MTGISIDNLIQQHLHFDGRTIGPPRPMRMVARNIAAPDATPDWRVADKELIRWLKHKGFRVVERAYVKD